MVTPSSVGAAFRHLRDQLAAAGVESAAFEAGVLLEEVCGAPRHQLETGPSPAQWQRLQAMAQRRCQGYPLQYLVGHWPFFDMELAVGPGVLIPRQDTEAVCQQAAALLAHTPPAVVVDLCSGSGAIALAMKRFFPSAHVTAVELSPQAMPYLRKNATNYGVEVVQADVWAYQHALPPAGVDLVIANPPYLTEDEMQCLQKEVAFEPPLALDGGADGLRFYRHIATAYRPVLRPGGLLVLEIGWQQAPAVMELLTGAGYHRVAYSRDLAGNPRCVYGWRPETDLAAQGAN